MIMPNEWYHDSVHHLSRTCPTYRETIISPQFPTYVSIISSSKYPYYKKISLSILWTVLRYSTSKPTSLRKLQYSATHDAAQHIPSMHSLAAPTPLTPYPKYVPPSMRQWHLSRSHLHHLISRAQNTVFPTYLIKNSLVSTYQLQRGISTTQSSSILLTQAISSSYAVNSSLQICLMKCEAMKTPRFPCTHAISSSKP